MILKTRLLPVLFAMVSLSGKLLGQAEPVPGNYKDNFTQGNFLMLEENYPMALRFFQEAYRTDSSSANVNFKVGVCLLKSVSEKKSAITYLRRAAKDVTKNYDEFEPRIKKAPESAFYYLAQAYHLNSKFDSAQSLFESYKTLLSAKNPELLQDVNHRIDMCKNAKEYTSSPLKLKITNMGDSINGTFPDYSVVLSLDENIMYFTSRRYGERGIDGLYPEDIYVSYRKLDNTWTTAVPLNGVNSESNEATISLSTDGQTLFIYKDDNGGDIYYSTQDFKGNWSYPQPLEDEYKDINTRNWETHACLSADGNTLYFVSNRKGGYGGRDIYRSVKLPNGKWSRALNLGPNINTPFDEDAPFIHPDKTTLFFSSSGHKSMGGFDIFFTAQNDSGTWAPPINMGFPINTPDDDVFYMTSADGKRAYFSSVREGSFGDKDIYLAELEKPTIDPPLTLLKGRIFNADGSPLTQEVQIIVYNNETGEQLGIYRPNPRTGSFAVILPPGGTYRLSYIVNGTEYYSEIITVPYDSDYQTYEQAFNINDLMLGKLKPVQADTAKPLPPAKVDFINLDGVITSIDVPLQPLTNPIKVTLKDDKAKVIAEQTTTNGKFAFKHIDAKKNYLILVDEFNDVAARFESINIVNEADKSVVKNEKQASKTDDKFKITETGKVVTLRLKVPVPEPIVIPKNQMDSLKETLTTVKDLDFKMYFKYNVSEIDPDDGDFRAFVDSLVSVIRKNGSVKLTLLAAASQVPTRKFATNKDLSIDRAEKCKQRVMKSLKEAGISEDKVTWIKVNAYVLGPTYHGDFLTKKKVYEKYQYVKIRGY